MIKVTYEDREYEFVGYCEYPRDAGATHYLSVDGTLEPSTVDTSTGTAHFRLSPKRYTLGGVVFEDTGEYRTATNNWVLFNDVVQWFIKSGSSYHILRPVEIKHAK